MYNGADLRSHRPRDGCGVSDRRSSPARSSRRCLAYVRTRDAFYFRGAMVADIAGVITALIAAIPGAFDMLAPLRRAGEGAGSRRHASSARRR